MMLNGLISLCLLLMPLANGEDKASQSTANQVLVEMTVLQLSTTEKPVATRDKTAKDHALTLPPAGSNVLAQAMLPHDATLAIGDLGLRFEQGEPLPTQGLTVLNAPKIIVLAGQSGEIAIGENVPYMVPGSDENCFELRWSKAHEGMTIKVRIKSASTQVVQFERLVARFNRVVDRQQLAGVPFNIGRPVFHSAEMSSAIALSPDMQAVVAFPRQAERDPVVLVCVRARLASSGR